MLSKNLFFHNFDAKLHYSEYYSLLKLKENDGIYIHDSVQRKKCNGRWNFIIGGKDYSCGVYHALELIRQSIFSAMENNKTSVDIALIPTKYNSDDCYVFNYEKEFKKHIDIEQLKKQLKKSKVVAATEYNEKCECDKKVSKQIFFKVIKPVLEEMFKKTDYQITTKIFKGQMIIERFGQFLIKFKRDLNVVHLEWCVDKFFKYIMGPNAVEIEFQLTA